MIRNPAHEHLARIGNKLELLPIPPGVPQHVIIMPAGMLLPGTSPMVIATLVIGRIAAATSFADWLPRRGPSPDPLLRACLKTVVTGGCGQVRVILAGRGVSPW